jgi:hypothetical protein
MALDIQGTDFLKLPVGTTGQRPVTPASGMTRQNSTTGAPEWYDSTSASWVQFSQQTATSPNTFGFKNRIINGGMVIDQRNAGASVTPTNGQYLVDRWFGYQNVASKYSAQQTTTAPSGFTNSLRATSLSAYSIGATDVFTFAQAIEGLNIADLAWGTASAASVTLSFRVYTSLTGTFGGSLMNSANSRAYPFTYSVPVANTWTTISVAISGDTSGTWLTTNGVGIYVFFGLGVGSTFSGTAGSWASAAYYSATSAVSVVGTSGATFYITGVQLEVGSTATSFDFRDYGRELILCQRYFQTYGGSSGFPFVQGTVTGGNDLRSSFPFIVQTRATPTATIAGTWASTNINGVAAPAISSLGNQGFALQVYSASSGGYYYYPNSADDIMTFSSEL